MALSLHEKVNLSIQALYDTDFVSGTLALVKILEEFSVPYLSDKRSESVVTNIKSYIDGKLTYGDIKNTASYAMGAARLAINKELKSGKSTSYATEAKHSVALAALATQLESARYAIDSANSACWAAFNATGQKDTEIRRRQLEIIEGFSKKKHS